MTSNGNAGGGGGGYRHPEDPIAEAEGLAEEIKGWEKIVEDAKKAENLGDRQHAEHQIRELLEKIRRLFD